MYLCKQHMFSFEIFFFLILLSCVSGLLYSKNKNFTWLFLVTVKEESEKAGLKLNIQKPKIMALVPSSNRGANRRGKVETLTNFFGGGSKNTVEGDCSREIKRHLLLGRRA